MKFSICVIWPVAFIFIIIYFPEPEPVEKQKVDKLAGIFYQTKNSWPIILTFLNLPASVILAPFKLDKLLPLY